MLPGDWIYEDDIESPFQTFYRHTSCEEAYQFLVDYIDDIETLPYAVDGGVYNSGIYEILDEYVDDILSSSKYLEEDESRKSEIIALLKKVGVYEVAE